MSDRIKCTKENPAKEDGRYYYHPDAKEVGRQKPGWPSGDIQGYFCPWCGIRFTRELPQ